MSTEMRRTHAGLPLIPVEPVGRESARMTEPCPYCGHRHVHGRPLSAEPEHLVAHCVDAEPNGGYYLLDAEEVASLDRFHALMASSAAALAKARGDTLTVMRITSFEEES